MDLYTLVLFIHILGALGLFSTVAVNQVVLSRLRRARSVAQVRDLLDIAGVAAKIEPPAALAILGAGLYLTATAWGWRLAWINLSLGAVLAVVVVGTILGAPRIAARTRAAAEAPDGPVPAVLAARIQDPIIWTLARVAAAVQLGIVYLMTVKPDLTGSLLGLSVALALGLIFAAPGWRGMTSTPPEGTGTPAEG